MHSWESDSLIADGPDLLLAALRGTVWPLSVGPELPGTRRRALSPHRLPSLLTSDVPAGRGDDTSPGFLDVAQTCCDHFLVRLLLGFCTVCANGRGRSRVREAKTRARPESRNQPPSQRRKVPQAGRDTPRSLRQTLRRPQRHCGTQNMTAAPAHPEGRPPAGNRESRLAPGPAQAPRLFPIPQRGKKAPRWGCDTGLGAVGRGDPNGSTSLKANHLLIPKHQIFNLCFTSNVQSTSRHIALKPRQGA